MYTEGKIGDIALLLKVCIFNLFDIFLTLQVLLFKSGFNWVFF